MATVTKDASITIQTSAWSANANGGYTATANLASALTPASDNSYFMFKPELASYQDGGSFATFSNWDLVNDIEAIESQTEATITGFKFYAKKALNVNLTVYYKEVL